MTITATVIRDSISPEGKRITTLQLRYPRFIHAEFMTHRQFSRNASSSRAIPVERLIQDVLDDPVIPLSWGRNQPGMQAGEEWNAPVGMFYAIDDTDVGTKEEAWLVLRDAAVSGARNFASAGYHKQVVNRLLEPFSHINVVVTATEWSNFLALRDHPAAEPHIQMLAVAIKEAMVASIPKPLYRGDWHLPYITDDDREQFINFYGFGDTATLIKASVARCARVSYLTHDGRKTTIEEDLALAERLLGSVPLHASPAEHQATPDTDTPAQHGNFKGWKQYRKMLAGECQ